MIHFTLLLILKAEIVERMERKFVFKFLKLERHKLQSSGIRINVPDKGKDGYKYAKVQMQVEKLQADKQVIFHRMKDDYVQEKRKEQEEMDALAANELKV
jgi:hypothetical protein